MIAAILAISGLAALVAVAALSVNLLTRYLDLWDEIELAIIGHWISFDEPIPIVVNWQERSETL